MQVRTVNGFTPLIVASSKGNLTVVESLVRAGAEKEAKDLHGFTPLLLASSQGHLAVVGLLVRAGTEVKTKDGCTPLMFASGKGHLPVVQALVRAGADVAAAAANGKTAEQMARQAGHTAVGAELGNTPTADMTPLHSAAQCGELAGVSPTDLEARALLGPPH